MSSDLALENDPLIQRARLLVKQTINDVVANTASDELLNNVETSISKQVSHVQKVEIDLEKYYQFKGGAINGSSFITTYADIRQHCKQGSLIIVNGYECRLKGIGGEWSTNCVELQHDYPGETNFDSLICIAKANNSKATHRIEAVGMQPVSSQSIQDAIKDLSSLNLVKSISSSHSPSKENKSQAEHSATRRSPSKNILLKYDMSAMDSRSDPNKDEKIQEELKKTQDRIAEWKRKIEVKMQEDSLLQQQPPRKTIRKERHYYNSDSDSKIPRVSRKERTPRSDAALGQLNSEEEARRKQMEEERRIAAEEARFIANEKKVQSLREKTEQRVQMYKERLQREQEEENNRLRKLEEERRMREETLLPQRRNRFMELKQHTEKRLQMLAAKEEERYQKSQLEAEKRLNALARERGRQKPTVEWFQREDDPIQKSRWKDSHSAPVLPPIHLTDNISQVSSQKEKLLRPKSERAFQSTGKPSEDKASPLLPMTLNEQKTQPMKRLFPLNGAMAAMPMSPLRQSIPQVQQVAHDDLDSVSDDSLHLLDAESIYPTNENLDEFNQMRYQSSTDNAMNVTVISDVTDDDNSDLRSFESKRYPRKKKRTGIPVWKRQPIPVPPYVPVPTNS
jgi:hypothetical protein